MMKNILVKLSGEAFGCEDTPFSTEAIRGYAEALEAGLKQREKIFVVCGGGNVCRGRSFGNNVRADYAGMLASVQNGLFLNIALEELGIRTQLILPDNFTIPYGVHETELDPAAEVVIYAGGVGEPGHSTDYVCSIKSIAHDCDIYFAKMGVDGVYDSDPRKNPDAIFIPELSFREIADKKLGIIDLEAAQLLAESSCKGYVFELNAENLCAMLCDKADAVRKTVIL